VVVQRVAKQIAELKDDGIGDLVERLEAGFAERDESGIAEGAEVFGDVGLAHAGGADESADGFFTGAEFVEDGEAARNRDGLELRRD
jgi:hypothetical protein